MITLRYQLYRGLVVVAMRKKQKLMKSNDESNPVGLVYGWNLLENPGLLSLSQTAPGAHTVASSFRSAQTLADPGKPFTDRGLAKPQHLGNGGGTIALGMHTNDNFAQEFCRSNRLSLYGCYSFFDGISSVPDPSLSVCIA